MRLTSFLRLLSCIAAVVLCSCSDKVIPAATLSPSEKGLLRALNQHRSTVGKKALIPTETLTVLAREDAAQRASAELDYSDNRKRTGFERLLTLSGKAQPGDGFGDQLLSYWLAVPVQQKWLEGNYSNIGVGSSRGPDGQENGVLLLGGF